MIKKYIFLLCVALLSMSSVVAQHNTSSPYTRYGYGNILDGGFGQSRAMGGLSYGLRPSQFVNPNNPASYTSIDSLTFRFEVGASCQISDLKGSNVQETAVDGNLEFLAFQFPIKKWVAFSFGLQPYSIVGYDYEVNDSVASSITNGYLKTNYLYEGTGGITQLYAGLAFRPFKYLSVGGNFQFNFGSIHHISKSVFTDKNYVATTMDREIQVRDISGNFGVQATIPVKDNRAITVGGVLQMKSQLNAEATQTIITTDTTVLNFNNNFDLPMYFGAGFVYTLSEAFLVGFDYKREMWSNARYFGEKNFYDRNLYRVGAQYLPDMNGRSYFQRMAYRLGANFSSSYYKVNGEQLNTFGITAGWGFPLKKGLNPTMMNVTFEYGHTGKVLDNQIREQYFKFTLNATINERWFAKRKLN